MGWTKLPALEKPGLRSGCNICGPQPVTIPMEAQLCVGFGTVTVSKDGVGVWQGDDCDVLLQRFEDMAALDPDHDWRVTFFQPLAEPEYQRHGSGEWVLVRKGDGFA